MHLAGVGVAYKLVCAANVGLEPLPDSFLELVAIGTIADMMPLDGENRTLAAKGLAVMNTKPCAGVAAIMKSNASEKGKSSPKAGFVVYWLCACAENKRRRENRRCRRCRGTADHRR